MTAICRQEANPSFGHSSPSSLWHCLSLIKTHLSRESVVVANVGWVSRIWKLVSKGSPLSPLLCSQWFLQIQTLSSHKSAVFTELKLSLTSAPGPATVGFQWLLIYDRLNVG